jgi:hypothetical protein
VQHLDRDTARALVDAGYMPLREYIDMFAGDAANEQTAEVLELGRIRTRQWTIPAHFARSMRPFQYRIAVNKRYSAA